ncbi:MAG: NUDIX domain-containing protein [Patescibacteria group bacterium]
MPVEKSAGAVIFRKEQGKIYYLLLHYPSGAKKKREYWDLPKGHIEKGEKELETARREVGEETGLSDIKFVGGFKTLIKYFFTFKGKNILKFVTFYLAETKNKNVKISEEHMGYKWLVYSEALKQLTFKNARDILKKANGYLKKDGTEKHKE